VANIVLYTPTDSDFPRLAWVSLITSLDYLPGLFTLAFSLKRVGTAYPLIALYTESLPEEGLQALKARGIPARRLETWRPKAAKELVDTRFNETWSRLSVFGMVEYSRLVVLDADMLVVKNMDELMNFELDSPEIEGRGSRIFGACHVCSCNPLKKSHYPADWCVLCSLMCTQDTLWCTSNIENHDIRTSQNCAYTTQHSTPDQAQLEGRPSNTGVAMPNGGLLVLNPTKAVYNTIRIALDDPKTANYTFADQEFLGDVFGNKWVGLPYIYNGIKSHRWPGVHDSIWRDDCVKNVHYPWNPKPWEMVIDVHNEDQTQQGWWRGIDDERKAAERKLGIEVI